MDKDTDQEEQYFVKRSNSILLVYEEMHQGTGEVFDIGSFLLRSLWDVTVIPDEAEVLFIPIASGG